MTIQRLLTKLVSFTLLCVLFTQTAFSQTSTITGKVTDDKGAPVQGATVTVKGTKVGASTSTDGSFTLTVPASATTLVVSSVGFSTLEVAIAGQSNIAVSIVPTQANLNEVVVIGYGTARRKDVTGAVATVNAKDFNQGPIAAPDQLLQNKTPGVEVSTSSGQPGGGTTIKIRGNSSILSGVNLPLVVVDGVPLDGRDATPSLNLGNNGLPFGTTPSSNPLLYIDPNDVQSMEVLKDANATAIYGSRGANGVIVITTKKAASSGTHIDFATSIGDNVGYMKTDNLLSASQFRSNLKKYNLDTVAGGSYDGGKSVNALNEIKQHKLLQSYDLSLSGGNDNGKFRASFLATSQPGIIKHSDLDKYLGTFNGTYKLLDKRVTIDFNLIVGHVQIDQTLISNQPGAGGNLMQWVLNWNPTYSFYNADGSFAPQALSDPNPMAALAAYSDRSNTNTVLGNISATVRIIKGLDYKMLYAINEGSGTRYANFDGWMPNVQGISGKGLGAISTANITSQTFTHTLNYNTDLTSDLHLAAVAGYEYWTTSYRNQTLFGTNFDINNTLDTRVGIPNTSQMIDAASLTTTPANPADPSVAIQSVFGRVALNYADKYYLSGTFRADGSSKFGSNNHYGYFPSVGARWVLSNEDFMKDISFINNIAIRGSWGITGSQDFPAGASQAQFNFTEPGSISQSNVPNPNLKWQKTTQTDIGLDFGLFKGRLYGTFDYYHKNTTQIVYQTTAIQPAPSGNEYINLSANLYNTGEELSLGGTIIDQKDLSWDLSVNVSNNKNTLKNFNQAPVLTGVINGNGLSSTYAERIANNQPIDVFYMPHWMGYSKTGTDSVSGTSNYAGDPNPHWLYGISTTLRYKHLSLNLGFGGAADYKIFNNTALAITNIGIFSKGQNVTTHAFEPGETTSNGTVFSDKYLESGNFLKLRNATVSYGIGDIGSYLKNVKVYVTGTNLFVITKFTGFDPEVNIDKSYQGYASRGMEYLPYPTPRILTVGLTTSF
jgi:TonB-dependent starch-binding outer membrane protein SusC